MLFRSVSQSRYAADAAYDATADAYDAYAADYATADAAAAYAAADDAYARKKLGWRPKFTFEKLVEDMCIHGQ